MGTVNYFGVAQLIGIVGGLARLNFVENEARRSSQGLGGQRRPRRRLWHARLRLPQSRPLSPCLLALFSSSLLATSILFKYVT